MSREVPLLSSEKIKLGILIGIVVLVIVSNVSGLWKKAYRAVIRDKDGYEQALSQMAEYYQFEIISFDDVINCYELAVDPDRWNIMSKDDRYNYCDYCYSSIRKAQVSYKMKDEGDNPTLYFYVNRDKVAGVVNELIRLY